MKRNDIDDKYKWNLTKIIKDEKEYQEKINNVKKLTESIFKMKGTILSSSESFKKYLDLYFELNLDLEKVYIYSFLLYYSDTTETKYKEKSLTAEKLNEEVSNKLSFVDSEIFSKSYEDVISLLKEKDKEHYGFYLEKMFRYQKYILSENEEKVISEAINAFGTPESVFDEIDNTDVKFKPIIKDGKEIELNHSNYINFMRDKNRKVRIDAFKSYYQYYIDRKNTISSCYKGQIKENFFISNVRKFDSPLEYSLYQDNIDKKLYLNLIDICHKNNHLLYQYMKLRKEYFNFDEMHIYDLYVDMIDETEKKIELDECKNILLNALKSLGETYINDIEKAFNNKWIDYMHNDGKRSGAYQWSTYNVEPYVSVNYEYSMESVNTLAHELGHAMHSYYSDKNNSFVYNSYSIFLAEIASTVNEVLLNEYMLKNSKSREEKILYVSKFLEKVRTTIFRQTMFAEFEKIMHDKYQNNIPLTESEFSNTYYELNKLYYGDNVICDNEIALEWARIPHFYSSFYVYKYATGLCVALIIANDILNNKPNAKENYIKFLSSGSSDYPLNILKKCGIDMTDEKVLQNAFTMFEEKLNILKELIEVK